MCVRRIVFAIATVWVCALAFAHSGPLETIARITSDIETNGASASLLVERAVEYRTINDYASAKRDLDTALALDPADFMALRELARVDLCVGDFDASREAINRALEETPDERVRIGLFALRAEIQSAEGNNDQALKDIAQALQSDCPEVDWFLQRSRLQWAAGEFDQRVDDLRDAAARNPSIVIQYELTDALIDAGHYGESLARVETELTKRRDCTSWRIRRARIRQGLCDADGAKADLETAIAALTAQLNEQRNSPLDVTVIVERATAYALLGDTPRAQRGLQFAKALQADEWLTAPLERLIDCAQTPTE